MSRLSKVGVIFLLTLFVGGPLAIAPGALARPSSVLATQRCSPWRIVPVPTDQAEVEDSFEYPHQPKILHWDGSRWTKAPIEGKDADLKGIDVISATEAWAVGTRGNLSRTTAFHWNGSMWRRVSVPSPEGSYDILYGVSATSASDVWAVGVTGYDQGLIVHWNGATWSVLPHPEYDGGEAFRSVVAVAPDDAWAVGERNLSSNSPIIQHWDGTAWTDVTFPHSNAYGIFLGVDASGPDNVWAVGINEVGWSIGGMAPPGLDSTGCRTGRPASCGRCRSSLQTT